MRAAAAIATAMAILLAAGAARAQAPGMPGDSEEPPGFGPPPPPAPSPPPPVEHRSPERALALSLGGTAAGFGLIALGATVKSSELVETGVGAVIIGPSFGHWYAGEGKTTGLMVRAGGLAITGIGVLGALSCWDAYCGDRQNNIISGLLITGAVVFVGGGIYDIATAPGAADQWNARHAQVQVTPTALPSIGGPAPGLALTGSF